MFATTVTVLIAAALLFERAKCVRASNETLGSIHVLAVLSTGDDNVPKWERGSEILPIGLAAVDEINRDPNVLDGYHIELVPLMVPMCDPIDGIAAFVELISSQEYNVVGVTGLFCTRLADSISPLAGHEGIDLIQLSGSTAYHPEDDSRSTSRHLFHMLPSSEVYARALIALMEELGWTKIGVIYSQRYHDLYYHRTLEMFSSLVSREDLQVETMFSAEVLDSYDVPRVLHDLQTTRTKIVFAFVPPGLGVDIMCKAYLEGLTWPKYAWILIDLENSDIAPPLHYALENVIVIKLQFDSSNTSYSLIPRASFEANHYSSVLYDSVWSLALAMNASVRELHQQNLSLSYYSSVKLKITKIIENELKHLSFTDAKGHESFSQRRNIPVEILVVHDGKYVTVGSYSSQDNELTLNSTILGSIPSENRVYEVYPTYLTVLLSLLLVMCILLTTVCLLLFLYYRKEPEVKASSFGLSICIFVGCYLLLFSSLCRVIVHSIAVENRALSFLTCPGTQLLAGIGHDLLFATLIAKTLRIYYIFKEHFRKTGKLCPDTALLLLIIVLTSIKFLMIIIWSATDGYRYIDTKPLLERAQPPHYQVSQTCYSERFEVWIPLTWGYSCSLFLVLLVLAVKTRKIKRKDFKDTKKLNALLMAGFLTVCIVVSLWGIMHLSRNYVGSKLVVDIGFLIGGILPVLFVFVPKVAPLLLRKFRKQVYEITSKFSSDVRNTLSTHLQEHQTCDRTV